MKMPSTFLVASMFALVALVMLGSVASARSGRAPAPRIHAQATLPPELPPDTKTLTLGQTLNETLDTNTPSRLYKFDGKVGQILRLDVLPQTPDFFTSVNIL